jgi:hypothetical protein
MVLWCRCGEDDCDAIAEMIGEFVAATPEGTVNHHFIVRCSQGHVGSPIAEMVSLDV